MKHIKEILSEVKRTFKTTKEINYINDEGRHTLAEGEIFSVMDFHPHETKKYFTHPEIGLRISIHNLREISDHLN